MKKKFLNVVATALVLGTITQSAFIGQVSAHVTSQGTHNLLDAEQYVDQALASAGQGNLSDAGQIYQKYTDTWLQIEGSVKSESGKAYSDIESNMGQVEYALIQNKQYELIQALQGLKATNEKFIQGLYANGTDSNKGIPIVVDGKKITSDVPAYMDTVQGRVMVPVRFISEALGATVLWDAEHNYVLINTPSYPAGIQSQDSIPVVINGQLLKSDVPAAMQSGRVFVPIRTIVEALQANVSWNEDSSSVQITSQKAIIKTGVTKMLSTSTDLKNQIKTDDSANIKLTGPQLEETWHSIEDNVKMNYPNLYENIEKYLDPTVAGSKVSSLDKETLAKLNDQLAQALNDLAQAEDVKTGITQMLSISADLKNQIKAGDASKIKVAGPQLEEAWHSFEDIVKSKYPEQYGSIEKSLDPTIEGSKADPLDTLVLAKLNDQLNEALNQLAKSANINLTSDSAASDESMTGDEDIVIGQTIENGMDIHAVYIPAQKVEPKEHGGKDGTIHLEADIHATKDNTFGFHEGEWIPNLTIQYVIENIDTHQKIEGVLYPMVADGVHYADNIDLKPGNYELTYNISAPDLSRHIDMVKEFYEPFTLQWKFKFDGIKK